MARSPDSHSETSTRATGRGESSPDWSSLLGTDTADGVLAELGRGAAHRVVALDLERTDETPALVGSWRGAGEARVERSARIDGDPEWRLVAQMSDDDRAALAAFERVVGVLAAWRGVRGVLAESEAGLAARSHELDLVQALGRRAAEARRPEELFRATAAVLQHGPALDLVLAAWVADGACRSSAYLSRPFTDAYIGPLVERASRFLGLPAVDRCDRVELETHDAARGVRDRFREEDVILLPVMRRGRPAACLLVVPARAADEGQLRVLYSASNQLALHLDRILTVREAEADRFRSIVDSMPQGVLLADEALRVVQANRAARRMLTEAGAGAEVSLTELLARWELTDLVARVQERGESVVEGEVRHDADTLWSVTVSPLGGEEREDAGLVFVITDVSESRRLQTRLAQSEKMSSLGQMISGVAHELNNPLASIIGYAQLVAATAKDERLAPRLETMRREAERCRRIVENLLSFARRRDPESKPLSLNQSVLNTCSLLDYQLRVDDVTLETELSPDLTTILGDAHQLEQVLVNLLTNAHHAIRQTGRAGRVWIRTLPHPRGGALLEIVDDGPGIPEAIRTRIFDPFFTTKEPGQGTGLGLSLAYGIVTAHGGTIETEARPEGGTVFRLAFPLAGAAPVERRPAAAASRPVRPGRILVVDDEEPLARMICDALSTDGHLAEWASNGQVALERVGPG